ATNDRWVVVVDSNRQAIDNESKFLLRGSTGGGAYGAEKDKEIVVIDGKESYDYFSVDGLRFSPDGNHVAYVAKTGDGFAVVADGKVQRAYDNIVPSSLQFSPDSSTLLYYAKLGDEMFVVKDDRASIAIYG